MNVLEVRNLYKRYDSFSAVDGLNFEVQKGDIYGFLGPNGAGKSTTLRMLLGLIKPSSGDIKLFGEDLQSHRKKVLSKIGAIVEKPDFYKYLSAKANLSLFQSMTGTSGSSMTIPKVIELVGLKGRENDAVKTYSHGMKQRLGLAQALLHDPDLILLDEPTTGLDPQGIIDLRNLILHLRDCGKTIFMSSHILSEIELIATRMVIISKGKALVEGTVKDLLNVDDLVVEFGFFDGDAARQAVRTSVYSDKLVESGDGKLTFRLNRKEIAELNQWFCSKNIAVEAIVSRRRLEDYFIKLTQ
jgi:ABC-type multidrug transport system ATPase subunit